MNIRTPQLHPSKYFHIFNRGINGQAVFFDNKNYGYFLQQYGKYVHPFVETYAYCLLGNHFHLLIRVRSEKELDNMIHKDKEKPHYWHVSNGFSSFLQSYTRAMNKMYDRTGAIFETPFKRIEVKEESYFSVLIAYIHENSEKHGLIDNFRDYPYSSYHAHLLDNTTKLSRSEVLEWFGGKSSYEAFHKKPRKQSLHQNWLLE